MNLRRPVVVGVIGRGTANALEPLDVIPPERRQVGAVGVGVQVAFEIAHHEHPAAKTRCFTASCRLPARAMRRRRRPVRPRCVAASPRREDDVDEQSDRLVGKRVRIVARYTADRDRANRHKWRGRICGRFVDIHRLPGVMLDSMCMSSGATMVVQKACWHFSPSVADAGVSRSLRATMGRMSNPSSSIVWLVNAIMSLSTNQRSRSSVSPMSGADWKKRSP